jgi:O-antigen/teichoic acid export membrane protein
VNFKILTFVGSLSLLSYLMRIISLPIFSRLLQPEDYGYFAIGLIIFEIASNLSAVGLHHLIIQRKKINRNFLNNVFLISSLFNLILILIGLILMKLLISEKNIFLYLSIFLLISYIGMINSYFESISLRYKNNPLVSKSKVFSVIFSIFIGLIFAFYGFEKWSLIIMLFCEQLIYFLLLLRKYLSNIQNPFLSKLNVNILDESKFFFFNQPLTLANKYIDQFLIFYFINITSLGIYSRARVINKVVENLINTISKQILFREFSLIRNNEKKTINYFIFNSLIFGIINSIICAIVLTYSNTLVSIILGNKWIDSARLLELIVFTLFLKSQWRIFNTILQSLNKLKMVNLIQILQLTIVIISFLFLGVKSVETIIWILISAQSISLLLIYLVSSYYYEKLHKAFLIVVLTNISTFIFIYIILKQLNISLT